MLDSCGNVQSEISKNFRLKLKEQKLQVKGSTHVGMSHIDSSPKINEIEYNFIPHHGSKSKQGIADDNEYFSSDNQSTLIPVKELHPKSVNEYVYKFNFFRSMKTKILSPKLFEIKDALKNKHQKTKEAFRYISIYRKALRNSRELSSSRTDLRVKEANDYDNEFRKTSFKPLNSEVESDLVPTDHTHHNKSARDERIKDTKNKNCELPEINGHQNNNKVFEDFNFLDYKYRKVCSSKFPIHENYGNWT